MTLENEAELAALGVPDPFSQTAYNVLDHQFASARGIGIAIVDSVSVAVEGVEAGKPALLLYAPDPEAADVIEPYGPDFPYTLIGWGYAVSYTPGEPPTGLATRCISGAEWFIHERSIHPADTWQNIPVPPDEEFHGADRGDQPIRPDECDPSPCPAGIQHPRIWDIHLWLDGWGDGVPSVSILNRRQTIRGWDPGVGVSFFYPYPEGGSVHESGR